MTNNINRLSQFWQELKRRKVGKVIAMYAGAAYVLIELTNNVAEPLNLPEWTPTLVILLLVVGFPITVILSWIFDVTPEGVRKTEPKEEISDRKPIVKEESGTDKTDDHDGIKTLQSPQGNEPHRNHGAHRTGCFSANHKKAARWAVFLCFGSEEWLRTPDIR